MGFMDQLKQGAGNAAFEADKRIRLARVEGRIGSIKQSMATLFSQLGEATYSTYKRTGLGEAELSGLCEQILTTEKQLEEARAETERIRLETPPTTVGPLIGHVCLRCQIQLPGQAAFCPRCGGPATDVAPPAPAATPGPAARNCPSCRSSPPVEARFCPSCGATMEAEQEGNGQG